MAGSQFVQGEGLYECPVCRAQRAEDRGRMSEDRGQRTEGQEKDEHRTSNEKMKQRAKEKNAGRRGVEQEPGITNQEITNNKPTDNAANRCGVFGGVMRAEDQLKRGAWEMVCPVCGKDHEGDGPGP